MEDTTSHSKDTRHVLSMMNISDDDFRHLGFP